MSKQSVKIVKFTLLKELSMFSIGVMAFLYQALVNKDKLRAFSVNIARKKRTTKNVKFIFFTSAALLSSSSHSSSSHYRLPSVKKAKLVKQEQNAKVNTSECGRERKGKVHRQYFLLVYALCIKWFEFIMNCPQFVSMRSFCQREGSKRYRDAIEMVPLLFGR